MEDDEAAKLDCADSAEKQTVWKIFWESAAYCDRAINFHPCLRRW